MSHFAGKTDKGEQTLRTIAAADNFNEWMYDAIKPFCKGNILEIGSGIGNISSFFTRDKKNITLSDVRPAYCNYLRAQFPEQTVTSLDLVQPDFEEAYLNLLNSFDTVFALNVVEHIQDDELAIANAARLLRPGGNLVILVPAYQWLYNRFDRELHHYRRYTRQRLAALMGAQVNVFHSRYFNWAGIPGWLVSGRFLNGKVIPGWQMKLFNACVPAFRLLDRLAANRIGLSVIVIGSKVKTAN